MYCLFAFLYFRLFALVYLLLFILGTTSLKKCFLSGIARITSPPTQILATCRNFVKKHHHEVTTGWISVVKVKRDTKKTLILYCNKQTGPGGIVDQLNLTTPMPVHWQCDSPNGPIHFPSRFNCDNFKSSTVPLRFLQMYMHVS